MFLRWTRSLVEYPFSVRSLHGWGCVAVPRWPLCSPRLLLTDSGNHASDSRDGIFHYLCDFFMWPISVFLGSPGGYQLLTMIPQAALLHYVNLSPSLRRHYLDLASKGTSKKKLLVLGHNVASQALTCASYPHTFLASRLPTKRTKPRNV